MIVKAVSRGRAEVLRQIDEFDITSENAELQLAILNAQLDLLYYMELLNRDFWEQYTIVLEQLLSECKAPA
jgi:hypothetical protein